jgi:small conductance mechanosensitive channel
MERAHLEPTVASFTANIARWGVLVLALVAVLGVFDVETASFAVVNGALGLAIGLALHGTIGKAASGFMLLVFRPFKVGDAVNAAGVTGKVSEIERAFVHAMQRPQTRGGAAAPVLARRTMPA